MRLVFRSGLSIVSLFSLIFTSTDLLADPRMNPVIRVSSNILADPNESIDISISWFPMHRYQLWILDNDGENQTMLEEGVFSNSGQIDTKIQWPADYSSSTLKLRARTSVVYHNRRIEKDSNIVTITNIDAVVQAKLDGLENDSGPRCPEGWIMLGPKCMEPSFDSKGTLEQALADCYQMGAKICDLQDLAYACSNREALGIDYPNRVWMWTGIGNMHESFGVVYQALGTYRRADDLCTGPPTDQPDARTVSWSSSTSVMNYACCLNA